MTAVTADKVSFRKRHGVVLHSETSSRRCFGQWRAHQIKTVAGLAAGFVALVKITVAFIHPARIVDIVQPVGAVGGQWKAALAMAGSALDDGSVVALKLSGRDVVVGRRIVVGPDGVGAAVAAFAADTAVALAEAEEGVCIFRKALVGCQ